MIYIFEGPDFSGKTTLAEKVSKYFNWPVFFKPDTKKYFPNDWDKYQNFYTLLTYNFFLQWPNDRPLIVDRLWLSAIIYSKSFDRKDDLSFIDPKECYEKRLRNIFIKIDNFETIEKRLNRGDDKKILDRMHDIWKLYQDYYKLNDKINGSLYINGEDSIENNLDKIVKWIENEENSSNR